MITSLSISLLLLINSSRVTPLEYSPVLSSRAQARAELLCAKQQWSHAGWVDSFKGLKWQYIGENLAKDFRGDATSTMQAWLNSPSHKANIVKKQYKQIGIGYSKKCDITVNLFKS